MATLNYWFLQTLAMTATAALIPKLRITSLFGAALTVVVLALVNANIWDAALFFKLPDSLSVHAALLFLSNGAIFWLLVKILPGIEVEGILAALIAPVVFTICSLLIFHYGKDIDWLQVLNALFDFIRGVRDSFTGRQPSG